MLKVILVDDEYYFRQLLRQTVAWAAFGFEVIGEASNGKDALELILQLQPDVVFLDINMPIMDGFDLCAELCRRNRLPQIVFLTGYEEFSYAKLAIEYGAKDYLLKPIQQEALEKTLRRVSSELHSTQVQRERLQTQNLQYLLAIRQKYLLEILNGTVKKGELQNARAALSLPERGGYYYAVIIYLEHSLTAGNSVTSQYMAAVSDANDVFSSFVHCFGLTKNTIVGIVQSPEASAAPIMAQCGALLAQIQSSLFSVVFAALGTPQRTFTEIPLSYRAAKLALGDHLLHPERQQFSTQAGSNAEDLFSQPMRAQLQQALLYHDKHLLQCVLRSLFLSFQSQPCTFPAIRRSCLSMLSCMSAFLQRQFPAQAMSVLKIGEFLEQAVYLASLEELEQRMTEQVIAVLSSYRHSIQAENPSRIEQIRTYILENLSDTTLSIESVSKRFYISYHYLCSFFKKQEGISLGEYIVDRRMERAKELIVSGVTNVTLLSASVGFSDPNYFSRCFKKRFSCSPSKYIESHVPAGQP